MSSAFLTTHRASLTMPYTLAEAAAATRKSRSTLLRAIQAGKLSGSRSELNGEWLVEQAEVHRLYPLVEKGDDEEDDQPVGQALLDELAALRRELKSKEDLLERERQRNADELKRMDDTVSDLRKRLDRSEDEWRTKDRQLNALLTDQTKPAQPVSSQGPERKSSWRFFGGKS